MLGRRTTTSREAPRDWRGGIPARFALAGATAGVVTGFLEAVPLYTTPRFLGLLHPDISYVIWFLSPLINALFYGLVGLVLGWAAAAGPGKGAWVSALLAAAGLGVAGVHAAVGLGLIHGTGQGLLHNLARPAPWLYFAAGVVGTILTLRLLWSRAAPFLDVRVSFSLALPVAALLATITILGCGLVFYVLHPFLVSAPTRTDSSPQTPGPNFVLITLDTVRADHLSAYGYSRPTTPHLERLARQGVLFENAISPSPWTLPSHASIFTELLPHQHGANDSVALDPGFRTLATILHSRGYETAGFSANWAYGLAGWGMGEGFDIYEDDSFTVRHNLLASVLGRSLAGPLYRRFIHPDRLDRRDAREINGDVFRWFRRRSKQPFFLFINYYDAHVPYLPPAPYDRRFGRIPQRMLPNLRSRESLPEPLPQDEHAALIAGYDNCLAFLDEQVGKLVEFLSRSSEASRTIVIITSDHGEAFGEHGSYGHGWDVYREVLHVPLIILGPGIPAGYRVPRVAQIREIFPTVLELVLGPVQPFNRLSLRRFWTPSFKPEPFDELAVSEVSADIHTPNSAGAVSLMTSEWHYLQNSRGSAELYHWPTDRQEKNNLTASREYDGLVQALQERLRQYVGRSLQPWAGQEYLQALDRPGRPFVQEVQSHQGPSRSLPAAELAVGTCQAQFIPAPSIKRRRPGPADEDLLRTLPYH